MIIIEDLTKKFQKKIVLDSFNLHIEEGTIVHIKGINGCGKTTLLKIIAGLMKPDGGSIRLSHNVQIGALIENPSFIENETILYNMKFLFNLKHHFDYDNVKKLCEYFYLDIDDKAIMKKYSVGMRQKAGIIQAVMEDQDLILFDEPTRGLDQDSMDKFNNLIKTLKNKGKTIIICAHDGVEGIDFDSIHEIKNGKIS